MLMTSEQYLLIPRKSRATHFHSLKVPHVNEWPLQTEDSMKFLGRVEELEPNPMNETDR